MAVVTSGFLPAQRGGAAEDRGDDEGDDDTDVAPHSRCRLGVGADLLQCVDDIAEWQDITHEQLHRSHVRQCGDQPARDDHRNLRGPDPAQLGRGARRSATDAPGALSDMGVVPGTSVAVLAGDPADVAPLAQAVWMRGASLTMLAQPTPRTDLATWLADTHRAARTIRAALAIVGAPFADADRSD